MLNVNVIDGGGGGGGGGGGNEFTVNENGWKCEKTNTFDMEPFVTVFALNHISICVWHQTCAININFLSADFLWYLAFFIKNRKWGKFFF